MNTTSDPQGTKSVARSGNLEDLRLAGRKLGTHSGWEEKNLRLIFKRFGLGGILAALDVDTVEQAAARIATPSGMSAHYLQEPGLKLWLQPGMEPLWLALCRAKPVWQLGPGSQHRHVWRIAMSRPGLSEDTVRSLADHHGQPSINHADILGAAIQRNSTTWQSLIKVLGLGYFTGFDGGLAANPFGSAFPATNLYQLFVYSRLMPRGRLDDLLAQMEGDPIIMSQMVEQRAALALGAMRGAHTALLSRVCKWVDGPLPDMPGGYGHLELGIVSHNYPNTTWEQRWPSMKLLGASKGGVLTAAMNKPYVIAGILSCADKMQSEHACKVLETAAKNGVNLGLLLDSSGRNIVQAMRSRQEEFAGAALSMIEKHALDKGTATSALAVPRRRF